MAYKVTAASAIARDEVGAQHIFYADDVLPDGLTEESIEHLLALEFIEDDGAKKKAAAKPAAN